MARPFLQFKNCVGGKILFETSLREQFKKMKISNDLHFPFEKKLLTVLYLHCITVFLILKISKAKNPYKKELVFFCKKRSKKCIALRLFDSCGWLDSVDT